MDFDQSLDYLYQRLPIFQRVGSAAIKKDLTNTIRLLEALGNPHHHFKSVHIAGTNGKGTSAHTLSSILQCAGYKTGLYTSPHLKSFTERIRRNGAEVPKEYVAEFVTRHQKLIEEVSPSFFEVTVAMAFDFFKSSEIDIAIVETGLGGRLDSTNVIDPEVALITMIGWDHADLLGDTLELIAGEKAVIIKSGKPVVIGADQPDLLPVYERKVQEKNARLIPASHYEIKVLEKAPTHQILEVKKNGQVKFEPLKTDITADYFVQNVAGVLTVCDELRSAGCEISDEAVCTAFESIKVNSGLKGRWHILSEQPFVIADVSHNEPGLKSLFQQVESMPFTHVHLIFGVVKDKDLTKILPLLPSNATFYFTQSGVPRSLSAMELADKAKSLGIEGSVFENVNDAIREAKKKAQTEDLVLICGSTFVVAEIDEL